METSIGHRSAIMLDMSVKSNEENFFFVQYEGPLNNKGLSVDYLPYKDKFNLSLNTKHQTFRYDVIVTGIEDCSSVKWQVNTINEDAIVRSSIIKLGTFFSVRKELELPKKAICLMQGHQLSIHEGYYEPRNEWEVVITKIETNIDHTNSNVNQRKATDKVTSFVFSRG